MTAHDEVQNVFCYIDGVPVPGVRSLSWNLVPAPRPIPPPVRRMPATYTVTFETKISRSATRRFRAWIRVIDPVWRDAIARHASRCWRGRARRRAWRVVRS